MMFVLQGKPSQGTTNPDTIVSTVSSLNTAAINAAIFSYSLGSGADLTTTKKLACNSNGAFAAIEDDSESLRTQMSRYYEYYSTLRRDVPSVVWAEPYMDASGAGEMTTASIALYDNRTTPQSLIGVLGIDVLTTTLRELEPNADTMLRRLVSHSALSCADISNLDVCDMEILRSRDVDGTIKHKDRSCDLAAINEV